MSKNRAAVRNIEESNIETNELPVEQINEAPAEQVITEPVAEEPAVEEPIKEDPKPAITFDPNQMLKELKTKSAVIRALAANGMKTNAIHKLLKGAGWHSDRNPTEAIRYQHVRNVLNQPLVGKRQVAEVATTVAE